MNEEVNISQNIEKIINKVSSNLQPGLEESIQKELAQLINLLPILESKKNLHLIEVVEVAISALLLEQPNIQLATEIRKDIEQRVREPPFHKELFGFIISSPSNTVIFGLCCSLFFITIPLILYFILYFITHTQKLLIFEEIFQVNLKLALEVIIAGALGSIVSIMVRIQEFNLIKDVDKSIFFFTGFFKPAIGASFALFVYALFKANLISLSIDSGLYFFMVLSFISGFSERFAKDIATTTEQKITGL